MLATQSAVPAATVPAFFDVSRGRWIPPARGPILLAEVPEFTVVQLLTVKGSVHYLMPFRRGEALHVALYTPSQGRLVVSRSCGATRSQGAVHEPGVIRQGHSVVAWWGKRGSCSTSRVDTIARCDEPGIVQMFQRCVGVSIQLQRFGRESRVKLLGVLQGQPSASWLALLNFFSGILRNSGEAGLVQVLDDLQPSVSTDGEVATIRMDLGSEVADEPDFGCTTARAGLYLVEPPTPVGARTVAGDLPPDGDLAWGRGDTVVPTVAMPLPGLRRAMAVMGAGVKGTVHGELRE